MSQPAAARRHDVKDCSVERLFSELVCLQLHRIMDFGSVHDDGERFARSFLRSDSDDDIYHFDRCSEPASFEARLASVESAQMHVTSMLQYIVRRLDSVLPPNADPVPVAMVPCSQPRDDGVGLSPAFDSSPPCSASPSPNGYAFSCPLCLKPQGTPKSHCEHMRKIVAGGGQCSFDANLDRHAAILHKFQSASNFIKWYISHLRSGTGREYTDEDTRAHADLQVSFVRSC